jgi:dihydropteroate synthase
LNDSLTTNYPLLMGIVNLSGDSFSEGVKSCSNSALSRAYSLLEAGANILDLGAESTRPGALEVPCEVEIARLIPVIQELKRQNPNVLISVDTRHAETAMAVLDNGATWINDVSMLRFSTQMADVCAKYDAGLILCHSRGTPENMTNKEFHNYGDDLIAKIKEELTTAANLAITSGVKKEKIIYDPGFGFGKNSNQMWEMMARANEFSSLGKILYGISRKSFLGQLVQEDEPILRSGATLAAELYLANKNAYIIRTHDVRALKQALLVQKKLNNII